VNYLLLIYGEEPRDAPSQEVVDQVMADYWAFEKAVADAGVKVGGPPCNRPRQPRPYA
jgi:hypothetical protein